MVTAYFTHSSLSTALREPLVSVQNKLKQKLLTGSLSVSETPLNIETFLMSPEKTDVVEEFARQAKLREAKHSKKVLEERLEKLNESINVLSVVKTPEKPKKLAHGSEARQTETSFELLKRLRLEKLERQEKLQRQFEKEQAKARAEILADLEKKKETEEELLRKRREAFEAQIQRRIMSNEERSQLLQIQAESAKLPKSKPLHIKLEEKFHKEILMPQLEENKALLAQKRALFAPLNKAELREHARRYREVSSQAEARRVRQVENNLIDQQFNTNLSSSFIRAAIREEKQLAAQGHREKAERKRLTQKRSRYSELVQELYAPAIQKKPEIQVESLSTKPIYKKRVATSIASVIRRRTPSPKPMPKSVTPKPKTNYIEELRAQRFKLNESLLNAPLSLNFEAELSDCSPMDKHKALSKITVLERKARKIEQLIVKQASQEAIELEEKVNGAMITAIKAKLALLES